MKPRFVFAHVLLTGVKTPVCVQCAGALCVLPEPAVCSALSRGHMCVFVSCACPSVPACVVGAGVQGSGGPAERSCCFPRPRRRVLLPRQPAPVSGAFGSWRPLPPVPDTSGPEAS